MANTLTSCKATSSAAIADRTTVMLGLDLAPVTSSQSTHYKHYIRNRPF